MRTTALLVIALVATLAGPASARGLFAQRVKPAAPGRFVTVDGMKIHYTETGPKNGKPVIALHGILSNGGVWSQVGGRLRGHRVITPDQPNHGYSDRNDELSMTIADQAALVPKLMDALKLEKAVLMGHSMGGAVAAVAAAQNPERVEKLVLADAASYRFKMPLKARLAVMPRLGAFLLKHVYNRSLLSAYMKGDVYHDAAKISDGAIDTMYAHFDDPIARAAAHRAGMSTADTAAFEGFIPKIKAPTLVLWGKQDKLIPLALGQRLEREIPDAKLEVIDQAGHEPMNEQPAQVAAKINAFLN